MPRDIVITLPAKIKWADYQIELSAVADWKSVLRFKVSNVPKDGNVIGGRCYLVWRGQVRGWMKILGYGAGQFTCETTGKEWTGRFIERSGPFHALDKPIHMRGFQGWRYWQTPLNPPVNGGRPE